MYTHTHYTHMYKAMGVGDTTPNTPSGYIQLTVNYM